MAELYALKKAFKFEAEPADLFAVINIDTIFFTPKCCSSGDHQEGSHPHGIRPKLSRLLDINQVGAAQILKCRAATTSL